MKSKRRRRRPALLRRLRMGVPQAEHIAADALLGALYLFPASLLADVTLALMGRAPERAALPGSLFMPLLALGMILPFAWSLLRAIVEGRLARLGVWEAVLFAALYAVCGFRAEALLPRFIFMLLLTGLERRQGSFLAACRAHGSLAVCWVILVALGARALRGLGFASCLLRLIGSIAFVYALKRAFSLPPCVERLTAADMPRLSRRDWVTVILALALCIAAAIVVGVLS